MPPLPASNVPQSASITLTSAPDVKDFEPPIPTLFDPYPGYYQLPSGEWAAHDPLFYKKVIAQLTSGVDPQAGTKTKSEAREFGGSSREDMATFDPTEELRKGQIAELEKRKAITTTPAGAPAVPRMKVSFCDPLLPSILIRFFPGSKSYWTCTNTTPTFHTAYRGICESRGTRRKDRARQTESQGSWVKIWCVEIKVYT